MSDKPENSSDLLALTTDIVSSHVANNTVAMQDLPQLIQQVYTALANVGSALAAIPLTRIIMNNEIVTCMDLLNITNPLRGFHEHTRGRLTEVKYDSDRRHQKSAVEIPLDPAIGHV